MTSTTTNQLNMNQRIMSKKVSFDFDNTLSYKLVQDYAKSLINKGHEVFILTARYNEMKKSFYVPNPTNEDLFEVAKKIGIKERNIIFTNMENKYTFLNDTEVLFHLDDCWQTIKEINEITKVTAIDVMQPKWKEQCNEILNKL